MSDSSAALVKPRLFAGPAATVLAEIKTDTSAFEVSAIAGPLRTAFSADLGASSSSSPPSSAPLSLSTDQQPALTATRRRVSFAASSSPLVAAHLQSDSISANLIHTGSGANPEGLKDSIPHHSTAGRDIPSYWQPSNSAPKKAQSIFKRNSVMPMAHRKMSAASLQKLPTRKASLLCRTASGNGFIRK